MAAGTQRLGLVILGLDPAAGRRAVWTERPCERSSASRFWVSRIWVARAAPVETNAAYGGAGVCGRSTRRWLPQWREAITLVGVPKQLHIPNRSFTPALARCSSRRRVW